MKMQIYSKWPLLLITVLLFVIGFTTLLSYKGYPKGAPLISEIKSDDYVAEISVGAPSTLRWQYLFKEIPVLSDVAPRENDVIQFVIPDNWKLNDLPQTSRYCRNYEIFNEASIKVLDIRCKQEWELADSAGKITIISRREGWGNDGSDIYRVRFPSEANGQYIYGKFVGSFTRGLASIAKLVDITKDAFGTSEGVSQNFSISFVYDGPEYEKHLAIADRIVSLMWLR